MYNNCNIINPKNKHLFTFIMLHPMHCNSNYFNNFLEYFERMHNLNYIYNFYYNKYNYFPIHLHLH